MRGCYYIIGIADIVFPLSNMLRRIEPEDIIFHIYFLRVGETLKEFPRAVIRAVIDGDELHAPV